MKNPFYDRRFKNGKHTQSAFQPVKDVAKERGIRGTTLLRRINEEGENGESAIPCYGNALFNSTCENLKL